MRRQDRFNCQENQDIIHEIGLEINGLVGLISGCEISNINAIACIKTIASSIVLTAEKLIKKVDL